MEEKENGLHECDQIQEGFARCDDKLLRASRSLNSNTVTERSLVEQSSGEVSCSVDKGKRVTERSVVDKASGGEVSCSVDKGKTLSMVQEGTEIEHIIERLKILEEELTVMKQVLFNGIKERKELINEIHHKFQFVLHFRNRGGIEEATGK